MASGNLHVGVDARELLGQPTGVGRYVANVLREWQASRNWNHQLTLFAHATPPPDVERSYPGARWVVQPDPTGGTRWEQLHLPKRIAQSKIDVFFAAGYTAPLRMPCPFAVAIYDVSFFAHPEWFPWLGGLRRRQITKRAAHLAAAVVTISQFSADEIVRWLGVPRERVLIAPPGAPPVKNGADSSAREPLVLFVGSLFTRRHIPDLLRGFALARRRVSDARLILVGDNRTQPHIDPLALSSELGIANVVEWRQYANDGELDRLYGSARVFAFLSDYEGFAMTPMEALAGGAPPVLLDTPVGREVYGDGATFVSTDPGAIADALVTLLSVDEAHAALLSRGRERLRAFSWTRTAEAIQRALERAAAG